MPKGPKVHPDIEKHITRLVSRNPQLQAKTIQTELEQEFAETSIPIPAIRTIEDRAKQIRDRLTIQEKPWSLAVMDKSGIPWEATHFLLQASIVMQKENSKLWPETETLVEELHERELMIAEWSPPEAGVMTVRQAKWLWRVHSALPNVELRNIFWRADMYAHREMMTDHLGYPFDASDLDRGLMTLLYHIEHQRTPAKKETEESQITGKEG